MIRNILPKIEFINRTIEWISPMIFFFMRVLISMVVIAMLKQEDAYISLFKYIILFYLYWPLYNTYFHKIRWTFFANCVEDENAN